jgi:hypothetical protein
MGQVPSRPQQPLQPLTATVPPLSPTGPVTAGSAGSRLKRVFGSRRKKSEDVSPIFEPTLPPPAFCHTAFVSSLPFPPVPDMSNHLSTTGLLRPHTTEKPRRGGPGRDS